ncbi:IS30 family transposase [Waltera sp.]|uniref:IS30 family transposase n=1 Tax=Waltera sp. TaxID=2815806 RepID=UPI0030776921
MTKHELHQKDMLITPLIYHGQSPYQILTNHPELDMSVRTLYSYLDDGVLTARNIDLKRKVKFKPRKVHKTQIKDRTVFERRMFTDFQNLGSDSFAEMDTVHSSQKSKRVILTFFLTREKLFLAFIMNRCTQGAVKLIFDELEHQLGTYDFLKLFNVILTDRDAEFGNPEALENGSCGIVRSSIYFCDPTRSGQKGGIEQAHTMLLMVLPKKTSFEFLTQWDLRTIVDHINSTPRESLGGRTPYDVVLEHYGIGILKALQLRPIPPDEVNLTPKLIRFNR